MNLSLARRFSLTQRLSAVFAMLLLACCGVSAWLQVRSNDMHEMEVVQGLSRDLAQHIASDAQLMDAGGLKPEAIRQFFSRLMIVNPSVEVYLLDKEGRIQGHDAPEGHLKRDRVDLEPLRRLIDGAPLPILGDDPRSADGRKVFSAAPLPGEDGNPRGYIYVVLVGEAHDQLAARGMASEGLRIALWSLGWVALLCLIAGLTAFALITRPLRRLTSAMRHFDAEAEPVALPVMPRTAKADSRDEIAVLETAFGQMALRIGEQWRELIRQDQERRELVANISHDLRTPLASLHGYLETLSLKGDSLLEADRRRYLGVALDQSRKVGGLAQALFELARLEHGLVQPSLEAFSLPDLVQDVFHKFELAAEARSVRLEADFPRQLPSVVADLGMIERVLTNLLDNALRYTPGGGVIEVHVGYQDGKVSVTVSDSGPGIPAELLDGLFKRPFSTGARRGGGLGLLIVHRMLELHHSQIRLIERAGKGATFRFELPAETGASRPRAE
ncbi:sensor histidine kinase [Pararobbsia alpina]|uniref:histidine kinase n=1 Tax=Pararobbsia alpina TaxID=621374 RepID=A0A6S7DAQ8_9BURK|nr:ATP-binding protein [Pararobbsia alpina]CAB3800181.1 Adaptive-response sensory-kinase SasA [Pararobbsia alpina]